MIAPILFNLILGFGCTTTLSQTETLLPQIYISESSIDFGEVEWGQTVTRTLYVENQGELPMGVKNFGLEAEGFEDNFALLGLPPVIFTCGEGSDGAQTIEDLREKYDTYRDLNFEVDPLTQLPLPDFVLEPGCQFSVDINYTPSSYGDAYASFHVESFIEEVEVSDDEDETAAAAATFKSLFYRDPIQFKKTVILHGYSAVGTGNIKVEPRTVDFGHLWTGEETTRQVMINNIGTGELILGTPYLGSDCHVDEFSLLLDTLDSDFKIPAEHGTIFEVLFTPTSTDTTYCTLHIVSDDVDSQEIEVHLKGNVGTDPNNQAPKVTIISPDAGYVHNSGEPLKVVLSMSDINQPANTLFCKVKSMGQSIGTYSCNPQTESGYSEVEIPIDNLALGVDSLVVTVTDQSQLQGFASTTILFGADFPDSDDDGDGYGNGDGTEGELIDCDDTDATVYPYAAEIPDGKDNDCDTVIDEKTTAGDDDGDSVTEEEGDCDDHDATVYPSAPEQPDLKDNDCDGIIDENTSLYDDDGDGFAEVDNDCNDRDPEINPAMVEYCDGIDNNCNNLRDEQEGCITIDSEPVIIGGIQMDANAISAGETTSMTVFVHEVDGQELVYKWEEDSSLATHTAISDATASTITWTAPSQVSGDGQTFSVYVLVTDEDGNQVWVFDEISVYSSPIPEILTEVSITEEESGCFSSSALLPILPIFLTGLFGSGIVRRRRRS